jgi:hypothetical protein
MLGTGSVSSNEIQLEPYRYARRAE